jgi:tetratricopeptide (TPR) repeat protein
MRGILLLLMFFFTIGCALADSLMVSMLTCKSDTERVNRLYRRGFALRNTNPALAMQYALVCNQQAAKCKTKQHLSKSYNLLGVLFYKKGDFAAAISHHNKALLIRKSEQDLHGTAQSLTNLGNIYTDLKHYNKAEKSYLQAMSIHHAANNQKELANCRINLAVLKHQTHVLGQAQTYYQEALETGKRINDYEIISICLNNLAVLYSDFEDYSKAFAFNQDALKIRQLMENHVEIADSYLNLAHICIKTADYISAKGYLDTASAIARTYDYAEAYRELQKLYAAYYSNTGDYKSAYHFLTRYQTLNDSLLMVADFAEALTESGQSELDASTKPINNLWLLALLALIMISIPYYLIKYLR